METWPYLSFEYVSHVYFWIDLAMPSHTRPSPVDLWLTKKMSSSYLYCFLRYWNFRNLPQSDCSRTFWAINQDLDFCQTWKLGWEVNYHNNFPFRFFLRNIKWKKILNKFKIFCFGGPFCPNTSKSEIFINIKLSFFRC